MVVQVFCWHGQSHHCYHHRYRIVRLQSFERCPVHVVVVSGQSTLLLLNHERTNGHLHVAKPEFVFFQTMKTAVQYTKLIPFVTVRFAFELCPRAGVVGSPGLSSWAHVPLLSTAATRAANAAACWNTFWCSRSVPNSVAWRYLQKKWGVPIFRVSSKMHGQTHSPRCEKALPRWRNE